MFHIRTLPFKDCTFWMRGVSIQCKQLTRLCLLFLLLIQWASVAYGEEQNEKGENGNEQNKTQTEKSDSGIKRDWHMSAPEAYFRAQYLHDYKRDLKAALPIYQELLKAAKGDIRAEVLYRAMYCYWILGQPKASESCFNALIKEFSGNKQLLTKVEAWSKRTLFTSRKNESNHYHFLWDILESTISGRGKAPRTITQDLIHTGTLDPGPGVWSVRQIQFDIAVRKASPEAAWSATEFRTKLETKAEKLVPTLIPFSPEAKAILEFSMVSLSKKDSIKPKKYFIQIIKIPVGKRKAWRITLNTFGIKMSGKVEVQIRVLQLAKDADIGIGYADRVPKNDVNKGMSYGGKFFSAGANVRPRVLVSTELKADAKDLFVGVAFERFPTLFTEEPVAQIVWTPSDQPPAVKATIYTNDSAEAIEGWSE